ncbi:MAG: tripartite tricarboxylate transporter TctB family protein [Deltaproteobacteria bacterium]|nr:tripartite tricarboxylate transporter TctB family protein [Deltaproteobacteria bacterium]
MRRYDLISSLVFLGCGVFITGVSLRIHVGTFGDPGPGLFPLITGILMGIISGGMFIKFLLMSTPAGREPLGKDKRLWHYKCVITVVIMFLYALTIDWLGFLPVTLLILFILYKAVGGLSLKISLGGAILTAAITYLLFKVWLKVQLPVGSLGI